MTYGVVLGAFCGYIGGKFDMIVMRILDVAMAFPFLVLIIVILAILGPAFRTFTSLSSLWPGQMYARLARAECLSSAQGLRLSCPVLGYPRSRIVFRHALPNVVNSSIVFSMSDFVLNILLVSGLSFLGLGVNLHSRVGFDDRRRKGIYVASLASVCTLPGLAIVITGTALSLIGDGLAEDRASAITPWFEIGTW